MADPSCQPARQRQRARERLGLVAVATTYLETGLAREPARSSRTPLPVRQCRMPTPSRNPRSETRRARRRARPHAERAPPPPADVGPSRESHLCVAARHRRCRPCAPAQCGAPPPRAHRFHDHRHRSAHRRPQQQRPQEIRPHIGAGPLGDPVGGVPCGIGMDPTPVGDQPHRPRPPLGVTGSRPDTGAGRRVELSSITRHDAGVGGGSKDRRTAATSCVGPEHLSHVHRRVGEAAPQSRNLAQ